MGYGIQGVWGTGGRMTWAMEAQGAMGTKGAMGCRGYRAHGQWGLRGQ